MGSIFHDGQNLVIQNSHDKMWFKCDNQFASKIMEALKKAKHNPLSLAVDETTERLSCKNDRNSAEQLLLREGYIHVGEVEDISLYVGVWPEPLSNNTKSLCTFKYLQDVLPNKHGSIQVNIDMVL